MNLEGYTLKLKTKADHRKQCIDFLYDTYKKHMIKNKREVWPIKTFLSILYQRNAIKDLDTLNYMASVVRDKENRGENSVGWMLKKV
jgi:hypothetical protein